MKLKRAVESQKAGSYLDVPHGISRLRIGALTTVTRAVGAAATRSASLLSGDFKARIRRRQPILKYLRSLQS
jgi:hypothetical protein